MVLSHDSNFVYDVFDVIENLSWAPKCMVIQTNRLYLNNGSSLRMIVNPNPKTSFVGLSTTTLIVDGAAFLDLRGILDCMSPVLAVRHNLAEKENKPYGLVIASPLSHLSKGVTFENTWISARSGTSIFKPIYAHWRRISRFRDDPKWYSNVCNILYNDKIRISKEIDLKFR